MDELQEGYVKKRPFTGEDTGTNGSGAERKRRPRNHISPSFDNVKSGLVLGTQAMSIDDQGIKGSLDILADGSPSSFRLMN